MIEVLGVGESIVDVIVDCDDSLLHELGLTKGTTHLVDMDRREMILSMIGSDGKILNGGSVANTMCSLGKMGVSATLAGKAAADMHGRVFVDALAESGVNFPNPLMEGGDPTSLCVVLVTPDGERTMNTNINPSSVMDIERVRTDLIAGSDIVFIEGYMVESAPEAVDAAISAAADSGAMAGISLADAECVGRNIDAFKGFVNRLDFCIGNEAEWERLLVVDFLEGASDALLKCPFMACTMSERGARICRLENGMFRQAHHAPAHHVDSVVDTTGAGDQFAAGFIYGLLEGWDIGKMAAAGNMLAGKVIGRKGAHLDKDDIAEFIRVLDCTPRQ